MKNLSVTSFFGGSEVIRVNYPTVYSTIMSLQEKQKEDVESLFYQIKQDYPEMMDIGSFSDIPDSLTQPLPFPNMKNIEVYLNNSLAIYFPNENQDFWFDILSLDYLFSIDLFNACILCLSKRFLLDRNIEIDYFFTLLNDQSFSILKFPLLFAYEPNIKETN
jgi:hypothetical protein